MDDNVFGHNILDLLGLSCDPRFGDNGETLIDLLKEIRYLIEDDCIIDSCIYDFQEQEIIMPFKKRSNF